MPYIHHGADPPEFRTQKTQIPHSENANSALRKCKFHAKKSKLCSEMEILHSNIEIPCSETGKFPQYHGKSAFSLVFCAKSGNSLLPCWQVEIPR